MITVGVPVSYVILTNAGMLIAVIVKLKRAPSLVKNVKRERNDLLIFAKLSTITEATWISAFCMDKHGSVFLYVYCTECWPGRLHNVRVYLK
jgi:hypothetical protein